MPASAYSKLQKQQKSSKSTSAPSTKVQHTTDVTSVDVTSQSFDAEQILYLQRTIGNRATQQLLQRQVDPSYIQRDAGAIVLDDFDDDDFDEDDDDDDEGFWDDGKESDETTDSADVETLRTEMQEIGIDAFFVKYGPSALTDVMMHLAHVLLDEGESALTSDEIDNLYERATEKPHLLKGLAAQVIDASPTMSALVEAGKAKERTSNYEHIMYLLRSDTMQFFQAPYLLLAKKYYYDPPTDFPHTDELKSLVETETWSWLLTDDMQTPEDALRLFEARSELKASEKADETGADPMSQLGEGVVDSGAVASQGLTIDRGVSLLSDINKETSGKDMVTAGMETLFNKIISYSFAPISIGADLIRAFHYNKRRRDGYEAAMARAGIDKDGHTDLKDDTPESIEKIRLGRVAHYAFKKTRRAFWGSIVKATLKLVRWISHVITLLSGGTTAVVTGAIAVASDVIRALMGIGTKLKGLYKAITKKRGAERKRNAKELMALAIKGNDDAIQTIWDVNPFDETTASTAKSAWNNMKGPGWFAKSMELPKPDSLEDFKESLKTGYYSKPYVQGVLTTALKTTMKST